MGYANPDHVMTFSNDGVEIVSGVLSPEEMRAVTEEISLGCTALRSHGIRNLEKKFRSIAALASANNVLALVQRYLGRRPALVRALFFDKSPGYNWAVGWHQDKTVTLNRRADLEGWGPWSCKEGVHHVQPPRDVLDAMVTVRLHLDSADEQNGPLRVLPGSHREGILSDARVDELAAASRAITCAVAAGDAVVMRPLIVHSSPKSQAGVHRRVVHLEYTAYELPTGLQWA